MMVNIKYIHTITDKERPTGSNDWLAGIGCQTRKLSYTISQRNEMSLPKNTLPFFFISQTRNGLTENWFLPPFTSIQPTQPSSV